MVLLPKMATRREESFEGSDQGTLVVSARISKGSFGEVSRCVSRAGEIFAVKRVSKGVSAAVGELACIAEGLRHRNLLRVQEAFKSQKGELCLRMVFAGGRELLERAGELTAKECVSVAHELAGALGYMHRRGCVHRDCKPENVILDDGAVPVLVDMGSMRTLGSVAFVEGTFEYMAPESRGKKKHRVLPTLDAWSLGATICVAALGVAVQDQSHAEKLAERRPYLASLVSAGARLMARIPEERAAIPSFLSSLSVFS